ncbi:MAG TPA: hypothetical protein VK673_13230 [Chthoniobacterales bacterium]|nr:hypothetical protein [Chthoniobacterales bacterium]
MTNKGLPKFLRTGVQKSYFTLSDAERQVLYTVLEKFCLASLNRSWWEEETRSNQHCG